MKPHDLTGQTFSLFTVISQDGRSKDGHVLWKCICKCGNIRRLSGTVLKKSTTKSCGCSKKEVENLVGLTFGKLLVLSRAEDHVSANEDRHTVWTCRCQCGNIKDVIAGALKSGKTKSCATNRCKARLSIRERFEKKILSIYKNGAKERNLPFKLTDEQFLLYVDKKCFYCGDPPKGLLEIEFKDSSEFVVYNGVDRVDSSVGYELYNCVTCCSTCNEMKMDRSQDDFVAHVHKMSTHLRNEYSRRNC